MVLSTTDRRALGDDNPCDAARDHDDAPGARDGECAGSRADVCELLKESGYIVRGVNDAQISQVVSGALDRLHQENDPCVRYDLERKLWIYLHGSRTEDELNKPPPSRFEPVLARQ